MKYILALSTDEKNKIKIHIFPKDSLKIMPILCGPDYNSSYPITGVSLLDYNLVYNAKESKVLHFINYNQEYEYIDVTFYKNCLFNTLEAAKSKAEYLIKRVENKYLI